MANQQRPGVSKTSCSSKNDAIEGRVPRERAVETVAGMCKSNLRKPASILCHAGCIVCGHVVFTSRCQILGENLVRFWDSSLSRCTQPHLRAGSALPSTSPKQPQLRAFRRRSRFSMRFPG